MTVRDPNSPHAVPLRRTPRHRLLAVLAAAGAWSACLTGLAPTAQAEDVRSKQWYLEAMQAEEMWKVSTGEGVKVAVVDSGVDPSTDALRGQVLPGKDLSQAPGSAHDDYLGHGTSMAAIISGTGKNGSIRGLAPDSKILPYRVKLNGLKSKKSGMFFHKVLRKVADSDAKIINMSLGGPYWDIHMDEAVQYALSKGKLLFASTGNDGDGKNKPQYPASIDGVVGVAALDQQAKVADFSQHGLSADLAAPGVDIPTWCDESLTEYCSKNWGTSMATAITSASAALIWAKHPDWTANQVLRVLVDTAGREAKKDVASKYIGWGAVRPRINLLEGKGDPGPADKNPIENVEPSTSPSTSSPEDQGKNDDEQAGSDNMDNASSSSEDDNDLWIYLAAGGAVAAVLIGAFVLVRRQNS